ncbi:MAG: biotin carboxylase N-terminal domain-containing protein, partial [Thermoanaerobaculia bacterium]|nr:biotin carboxylase N-terminal domain-containing protein [Thermoanaerobaculia bacterium]
MKIRRVLVANRGEIAARIARTCRELGVETVLARAENDLVPPVARLFDRVVNLGEGTVADTYLNVGRIIDAAKEVDADAIHPGYGFLSERPSMAAAAEDAGLIFVGPTAGVIEKMGSKTVARQLMRDLGVPV